MRCPRVTPLTGEGRPFLAHLCGHAGNGCDARWGIVMLRGAAAAKTAGSAITTQVLTMPDAERNALVQGIGR